MIPDPTTLARELVARVPDVWAPGMLDTYGRRVVAISADGLDVIGHDLTVGAYIHEDDGSWCYTGRRYVEALTEPPAPVLADAATAGCLLARLRTANEAIGVVDVVMLRGDVDVHTGRGRAYVGASLGEAVARALLALTPETP